MNKPAKSHKDYKTSQLRIATPVNIINLSNPSPYNGGGLNFGTIVEVYGPSKGGKSTFVYQTASYLLRDYGEDARIVIMAVEGWPNASRLRMAFGVDIEDDPRVIVEHTATIEQSNDVILRYAKEAKEKDIKTIIIWDSISASSFNRAKEAIDASIGVESAKKHEDYVDSSKRETGDGKEAQRGMTEPMARAQVLKWCLNNALHACYRAPVTVLLINQITSKVNQFNVSIDSGGGHALRHNVEERIRIDFVKNIGGDGKGDLYKTGTLSKVTIVKSRNVPCFQDLPIKIDDTIGGVIEEPYEIPMVAHLLDVLSSKSGGWYQVAENWLPENAPEEFKKSKQLKDIQASPEYLEFLKSALVKFIRSTFKLVDFVYRETIEEQVSSPKKEKGKESVAA